MAMQMPFNVITSDASKVVLSMLDARAKLFITGNMTKNERV